MRRACPQTHQAVSPTGRWGRRGGVGFLNSARLIQIRSGSSVTFQSSLFKRLVSLQLFLTEVGLLVCFTFYANFRSMHNYLMWLLHSLLSRAPYVVLFDLKPLIEDGNLQVYMYCVQARKRASAAPRTHALRESKISKFPGGMPPDHTPFAQSILQCPTFCIALGPPNPLGGPAPRLAQAQITSLSEVYTSPVVTQN